MAETFEALRLGPDGFSRSACIKCIHPGLAQDARFVELFLAEASLSARLHHDNIAGVLDFGEVDGSYYLALELIEGLDLRALLRASRAANEAISPDVVVHLAVELAFALDFAHAADPSSGRARGVVHRDISPSNILLSHHGEVKLTDFGIAKAMSSDPATRTATIKGKVPYMAPEYARGGHFRPRSDLFSLGVTLYECLAGHRPFDGPTSVATLEKLIAGRCVRLEEVAPHTPPPLARIIDRLIAARPEARFQTAGELLDALQPMAPPATARLGLGALVSKYAPPPTPLERAATEALGTVAITDAGAAPRALDRPGVAGPADETRTHAPARDDVATSPGRRAARSQS